jgi:hypothetical protein
VGAQASSGKVSAEDDGAEAVPGRSEVACDAVVAHMVQIAVKEQGKLDDVQRKGIKAYYQPRCDAASQSARTCLMRAEDDDAVKRCFAGP